MNILGVIAGLSAFVGIWLGHVGVRKIERTCQELWQLMLVFTLLGFVFEFFSFRIETHWLSAIFGILGLTFLWDVLEFKRQETRVKKGHAPANPANPRHIQILFEYPAATVQDFLDRQPVGHPVSLAEDSRFIQER